MKHQNVIFTNSVGDALNKAVEQLSPRNVFVLTDENVERESLASFRLHSEWQKIVIPAGDINKNLDSAQTVWNALQKGGATRKSLLVNIGGGVVTDLGGFAAATFKRGIRFINASDFCIDGPKMFTGFVCGIAAQDYDLRAIYINSFMKVVKHSPEGLFGMFDFLREFSEKTNIELYISISSEDEAPDYLKAFINQ